MEELIGVNPTVEALERMFLGRTRKELHTKAKVCYVSTPEIRLGVGTLFVSDTKGIALFKMKTL